MQSRENVMSNPSFPKWQRVSRWLAWHVMALVLVGCSTGTGGLGRDPLPSWNNSDNKYAIFKFVADVQREGSPTWVPPAERIAVFDNDGTLWTEYPQYTQVMFMLEQVKTEAPKHPEWKDNRPSRPWSPRTRPPCMRPARRHCSNCWPRRTPA